jgi:predicted DNA-binding protein with PD1-like motif
VEALGGGTLAHDPTTGDVKPHLHVTVGLKEHSATGHTSHLLSARVQFLTEMIVVEVISPDITREPDPTLYNVPLLRFPTTRTE